MKKYGLSVFISLWFVILAAASARAGALWLYEEATPDMGVAGAGRQAAAMDASTASGNPAGMTRLGHSQMAGGLLGFFPGHQVQGPGDEVRPAVGSATRVKSLRRQRFTTFTA